MDAVPPGSLTTLTNPSSATPSFWPDTPGDYTVSVQVTDADGLSSVRVPLVIFVGPCGLRAPTVDTISAIPAMPNTGDPISLSAFITDLDLIEGCDTDPSLIWSWRLDAAPAGSAAALSDPAVPGPSFTADLPGDYTVSLQVTDADGLSSVRSSQVVSVSVCGSQAPIASLEVLNPIIAGPATNLAPPDPVDTADDVWLDASSSVDPDATAPCNLPAALSYQWSFVSLPLGSQVAFNDPTVVNPTFVPDAAGIYELMVTVSDGQHQAVATATITAIPVVSATLLPGFSVDVVELGNPLWDRPEGITTDAAGNIFVAQRGFETVTVTVAPGQSTIFSVGGFIDNPADVLYWPTGNVLFMTHDPGGGTSDLLKIDMAGTQSEWAAPGELSQPEQMALFVDSLGNERLVVADNNNSRFQIFDPADPAPATALATVTFGGNVVGPFGAAAQSLASVDYLYAGNMDNNSLWRNDGLTDVELGNFFDSPRHIAISPAGRIAVADSGSGFIYLVDDCAPGTCGASVLIQGQWQPWGLWFESATELLVTDRQGNGLYRITGPF
jgi:hypothetical protein